MFNFPEMKISRSAMDYGTAVPGPFDGFFSFPISKGGYSGVGVYTDSRTAVPLKAEEGISGKLQPKPPLSPEERIGPTYPLAHELDLMTDEDGKTPTDLAVLDAEGRGLILDFGLFVLFNLYCPNESSDARHPYKMNFHYLLHERVKRLVEQQREVIVLGDINICSTPLDHAEGHLERVQAGFYDHSARKWLQEWLDPETGVMTDVIRSFWPDRKGMYTCTV
jgi:AP endonuclease-2